AECMQVLNDLGHLLLHQAACRVADRRPRLDELAADAHQAYTRQIAYAGLVVSDNGVDKTWAAASKSESSLRDLIDAMPAVPEPKLRAAFYPKVQPLLNDRNENLRRSAIDVITFIEGH